MSKRKEQEEDPMSTSIMTDWQEWSGTNNKQATHCIASFSGERLG